MTNVVTLVHVDVHRIRINEWFCQTVQGHGVYIRPLPRLLIWFQTEKHGFWLRIVTKHSLAHKSCAQVFTVVFYQRHQRYVTNVEAKAGL